MSVDSMALTREKPISKRAAGPAGLGLVFLLFIGVAGEALAMDIQVVALFSGKAMVLVDGERFLLAEGESTPQGLKLIEADSRGALIEHEGEQRRFPLGGHIGGAFKQSESEQVHISRDNEGMFSTVGSINGQTVQFLVDTGASVVAMSEPQARRLGIPYKIQGTEAGAETASGYARAWGVRLNSVKVGSIEVRNVEAMVIEGGLPSKVLLGQTFLHRVTARHEGNLLVLEKGY